MKRFFIGFVLGFVVIAAAGAVVGYWYWLEMQTALDRRVVLHEPRELFEIKKGTTLRQLASELFDKGWLQDPLYLRLEARRLEVAGKLKAGTYEIADGDTPRELLDKFVDGDVKVFSIQFIEGSTFKDMRRIIDTTNTIQHTAAALDDNAVMNELGAEGEAPEGRFFPSTYHYNRGDTDLDILRRAYRRMAEVLALHWAARAPDLPYQSADEALVMASIIEKETGRDEEREEIAGVFVRRLNEGMKLQTDPTVIYGLGEGFDGNLRRVDLETDTPYNTYTRHGLPPTPIALPGEQSIRAALHPKPGKTLYFVGKGDGTHQFSETLKQHNRAVRKYQLKR